MFCGAKELDVAKVATSSQKSGCWPVRAWAKVSRLAGNIAFDLAFQHYSSREAYANASKHDYDNQDLV